MRKIELPSKKAQVKINDTTAELVAGEGTREISQEELSQLKDLYEVGLVPGIFTLEVGGSEVGLSKRDIECIIKESDR